MGFNSAFKGLKYNTRNVLHHRDLSVRTSLRTKLAVLLRSIILATFQGNQHHHQGCVSKENHCRRIWGNIPSDSEGSTEIFLYVYQTTRRYIQNYRVITLYNPLTYVFFQFTSYNASHFSACVSTYVTFQNLAPF
jgi:hypothetical protein